MTDVIVPEEGKKEKKGKDDSTPTDRVNDGLKKLLEKEKCEIHLSLDYRPDGVFPVARVIDLEEVARMKEQQKAKLEEELSKVQGDGKN
jgi:hypothetical protein